MSRAANMQALTNDVKRQWPGAVVYGIGDTAHKASKSGHNEDDTPGSRPELEDSDSRPEHRAIDIMVRGPFTKAAADALVARLLADPKARARLYYIIWNGYQWSRSSGWVKRKYTGSDQHTDHVHASGWAADDENTAGWPAVAIKTVEVPDMTPEEHNWLATVHQNLTLLDGRNPIGQIYTRMAMGTDATDLEYVPETPTLKSIGEQITDLQTALTALAGRDVTDEPAIIQGVLSGLTPEKIAAAIPPTMARQVADELARRLVAETTPQS